MIEITKPKIPWYETYAAEIAKVQEIVAQDALNRLGSFGDRNPILGKMSRCPSCHARRRNGVRAGTIIFMTGKGPVETDYSLPCCNAELHQVAEPVEREPALISSNKWTWNEEEKQYELKPRAKSGMARHLVAKKRWTPRLTRNRPPLFEMHDLIKQWESEEFLQTARRLYDGYAGLPHFWTPQKSLQYSELASFAEKFVVRKRKNKAKLIRKQRQQSRRINYER